MRYIKYIFIMLFVFIAFQIKAYALDEYDVDIDSSGGLTVKVATSNAHTTVSDYSNIVSFSENVLTVKEGAHINYLRIRKSVTLTSNDKEVYINIIACDNSTDVVLTDLTRKTYTSTDTSWHLTWTDDGTKYKVNNKIYSRGNLSIISSKIEGTAKTKYDDCIYAAVNLIIKDSYIITDNYIQGIQGSTITNSSITTTGEVSDDGDICSYGDMIITNSTVKVLNGGASIHSHYYSVTIIGSDITSELGIWSYSFIKIQDSNVETTGKLSNEGFIEAYTELVIEDSTINLQGDSAYLESYTSTVNISNSNVTVDEGIYSDSDMVIENNSVINTTGKLSNEGYVVSYGTMTIKNSTLILEGKEAELASFTPNDTKTIKMNDKFQNEEGIFKEKRNTANSDTGVSTSTSSMVITDSKITLDQEIHSNSELKISNSKISITGKLSDDGSIGAHGEINIIDSNIGAAGSNAYIGSDYNSLNITSSKITIDVAIAAYINLNIVDSEITSTGKVENGSIIEANKNLYAENCTINLQGEKSYIESSYDQVTIVNCTINNDIGIYAKTALTIKENSNITVTGSLKAGIYSDGDVIIEDSVIDLQGDNGYIESVFSISVTNSLLTLTSAIHSKKSLNIKSSNIVVATKKDFEGGILSNDGMVIEDSTINLEGIECTFESMTSPTEIINSKITVDKLINMYDDLTLKDSTIITTGKESHDGCIHFIGNADIENSKIVSVNGLMVDKDLTLIDSTLSLSTNYDEELKRNNKTFDHTTYSPFIVMGNLSIKNSKITASTPRDIPAVLVKGTIKFLDENYYFTDENDNILDVIKVKVSKKNFLKGLNDENSYDEDTKIYYFGNEEFVEEGDEVYTTSLKGKYLTYSTTNGFYDVTLKIKNGTWSDGTSEDKIVKVLLGDKFSEKYYPDYLKKSSGSWVKTGDNEYTYEIVSNPKTGIINLTWLLIISIIGLLALIINKDKFTVYKKL